MSAAPLPTSAGRALAEALELVAAAATETAPGATPFPEDAIAALEDAGALAVNALPGPRRPPAAGELALVRSVSQADGGVGRILDGHLNAVERLAVAAEPALRDPELALVRAGRLRSGVWGGDPRPGEGPPARLVHDGGRRVVRGVKTFCSGASGLDRALVLVQPEDSASPPVAVWLDLADRVDVDTAWFASAGMPTSVSHRVIFRDTPVLAVLGGPGWLGEQPWIGRDALRTSATWAGLADAAATAALDELATRPERGDLEALAAGRIRLEAETIDLWQRRAAEAMDRGDGRELATVSIRARAAIAAAAARLLDEAARACGSHPFATGGPLDRARRDLELFVLQHRLDPAVAREGAAALERRA